MRKTFLYLWSLLAAVFLIPANVTAQSWTASAPQDGGTYYLYSVSENKFLAAGTTYGTRASLTAQGGIPVTLTAVDAANGIYSISSAPTFEGRFLGVGTNDTEGYLDVQSGATNYSDWKFIPVDGQADCYLIQSVKTSKYMVAHASKGDRTSVTSTTTPTTSKGYWKLVTPAELIANLSNATADNPIDATFAVLNHSFSASSAARHRWNYDRYQTWNGTDNNKCVEQWNNTFDMYQTITGLPNGVYKLRCQGFYRMGGGGNDATAAAAARTDGTEALNAKYYINATEGPLKSIFDYSRGGSYNTTYNSSTAYSVNGSSVYVPSNLNRASECFEAGEYWTEDIQAIVTDGTITIGFRKTATSTNDWAAYDNVVLTYYGIDMTAMIEQATAAWQSKYEAIATQAADRTAYDAVMDADAIAAYCTTEEKLAEYEGIVWQAVCDMLKDTDNANVLFDITSLVQNPTFDTSVAGWTAVGTPGNNATYGVAEFYDQSDASLTQTLAAMPAGHYTLKAQAFYRSAAWRTAVINYQLGTDVVAANLMLGNATTPVCNIYDQTRYQPAYLAGSAGGSNQKMAPDTMHGASAAFDIGQYWNILNTTTAADGDLTIGLNITGGAKANWMCFDDFRLYYGNPTAVDISTAMPAEDTEATSVTTGIELEAGIYNPVCLPFDLDATQTVAAFSAAYTLAGVNEYGMGQLVPAYTIEAGKAYYVEVAADKTLTIDTPVRIRVAQPDSIPVMWEGAATVGTYEGFTFTVNGTSMNGCAPVNFQHMMFTVNQENWRVRRFLSEFEYPDDGSTPPSKVSYYNAGHPVRLDQPHSVFIPVPQNNAALTVTVSKNSDYSEAETFTFPAGTTLCEVPNLIPQNTYYYKVEAGSTLSQGQFQTEGHLRMIKVNTGFNVRDLGGWENIDGKRVNYGKVFRGGELNYGHAVSQADLAELSRLGVGAEVDFRFGTDVNNETPNASALGSDVPYLYIGFDWADMTYSSDVNKQHFKDAFDFTLENLRNEKAVYFHCRIGADRTGMFGFLLDGLCGLPFDKLLKEYELTTFSEAGTREWNAEGTNTLLTRVEYIKDLPGSTWQQKFFYYMNHELGIDDQDIFDFIEIMVGDTDNLKNCDLAFGNPDGEYLQTAEHIAANCSFGSEIVNDAKAQLSDGETTTYVAMSIDGIVLSFAGIELTPGKDYTLTIPAGAIQKDGVENAGPATLTFHTPAVFDGYYYIYNTEENKFLGRGRNWGTRAVLDNYGIPTTISTNKYNVTQIYCLDNSLYFGSDAYTDKATDNADVVAGTLLLDWTLEPRDEGFVIRSANGNYLKIYKETDDIPFARVTDTDPSVATPFVVKSTRERKAIVEATQQANILAAATAAGITATSMDELATALTEYTAQPSSAVIKSARSGSTTDWPVTEPYTAPVDFRPYNVGVYGGELYQLAGYVSQTVNVPHPGLYKLSLTALYRHGTNEGCVLAGNSGYEPGNAYVSINDTYFARIPDWYSDRASDTNPNNVDEAKALMDAGKYAMEVYAYIGEEKQATIKVVVPSFLPNCWCLFNNFALTEYAANVTLSETDATAPAIYENANVTFNRTIVAKDNVASNNAWNTICFPFALSNAQLKAAFGDNVIVKALDNVTVNEEKASLSFTQVDNIEANKPYILQTDQSGTQYTFTSVSVTPSEELTQAVNGVEFVGNYVYPTILANEGGEDYYILNDTFKHSKGGTKIKGFRAYFHVPESSGIKSIGFDEGEATGIESLNDFNETKDLEVYDLSGRRVQNPTKGFYIINGKKTFVK